MKHTALIILISIAAIGWKSGSAQFFAPLTIADRENYVLSINQKSISKARPVNANVFPNKTFSKLTVKLSNNSGEPLRYMTMSCGWEVNFTTDNDAFKIAGGPCQYNVPVMKTIQPHTTSLFTMYIAYDKAGAIRSESCKIGMLIIKESVDTELLITGKVNRYKENLIWSNDVKITN